ncbi:MFS transporter [Lactiplantibacillus pentosus]|uniref:MFS transporter n=1 Tax=Lactiplantibacillus pentosus TaxID=1589 RepID=UPI001C1F5B2D|nr:MFS transporter [Lactiplantibacillus pentosus]MBU7504808.1 MFS transporter [Lactiplantibacillus pentosus]MDY1543216.1 MFS transporter [Lactiplantibacillus pentosus]
MSDSTKVTRQELVAIFAVALMAFVGILVETSMNVTFPTLMKTMHVSLDLVQWITTGYLLTVALLMLTSAFLHQRFKNRQLFAVGASLFILGDLICALAPNFWVLLFGRVVQAGCAGLAIPLMFNVILETVPRARLGFYMGLAGLILMIAPASGPTFGGVMVALGSWRWIFWSTLPVEAIILLLGYGAIRQVSEVKRIHFDWSQFGLGQHLSIIVILMLYIVFSIGRSMAFSNTMTNGLKEVTMAERADANAIYNTGQQFAGSLGTTILAALMSSVKSGQLSAARETAMGSQLAFGLVLVLGLVNFVLYRFVFKYQVTDK